jgi:phenylalanyl-tRNA synthetase beta chain
MVDAPQDIKALCDRLDLTGTAVEGTQTTGEALDNIVVGHILKRDKHPDADSLWVTTVDVADKNVDDAGQPATLQIVCGAQNFVAGDKVPVAMVGAKLPGDITIKKAKLRGVESRGMNCSARELGLGEDHEGLLILPADAPVGMPIAHYLGLADTVIDLEITPNRPDCMSMLGVAREIAAVYDLPYKLPAVEDLLQDVTPQDEQTPNLTKVSIDDPTRCARYTARIIKGVTIAPSPAWLQERVRAAGARPINNIVDITNYIMFECGQPLHAFDLDTLTAGANGAVGITVRPCANGELFTTLDGVERTLTSDITAIVDANANGGQGATIALAGVMGGLQSEVTDKTVNILLESATFSSAHTSRTSRNLQLFSEAAARYERGVDAATCDEFSLRAAQLMAALGGGTLVEGVVDCYPVPPTPPTLTLRSQRLQDFIGAPITPTEAQAILTRLGCECHPAPASSMGNESVCHPALDAGSLIVTPPTFRPDLEREIDLYEEILRIWGMERVEPTLPGGRGRIGQRTTEQARIDRIGATLRGCGLNETMTYAFAAPGDMDKLGMSMSEHEQSVELLNPIHSEQSQMRRSIIPGLLRSVAYNQNHGTANVHLYEQGAVFFAAEGRKQPKERMHVAAVLAGGWHDAGWNTHASTLGFFDGKGIIENLLRELNITKVRFKPLDAGEAPWLQPGRAAAVLAGSKQLGWLGEIHPNAAAAFDAAAPVTAFELDVAALLSAATPARPYKDVPQFPAISYDLALVLDQEVSAERVMQTITSAAGKLLDDVRLFDVYEDADKIGAGKRSLAFTLTYRDPERTLTHEEAEAVQQKVIRKTTAALKAEVR